MAYWNDTSLSFSKKPDDSKGTDAGDNANGSGNVDTNAPKGEPTQKETVNCDPAA